VFAFGAAAAALALAAGAHPAPQPAAAAAARPAVAAPPEPLRATVTPAEIPLGGAVTVSGTLAPGAQGGGGQAVALQAAPDALAPGDPAPFATVAEAATLADGTFAFAPIRPERNTRLRVVAPALGIAGAQLEVTVDPLVVLRARSLGPGRVRLSLRLVHVTGAGAGAPVQARWFLAPAGSGAFAPVAGGPARDLAPGVLHASTIVEPPARRFRFRVCVAAAWTAAMGPRSAHVRCAGARSLAFTGRGTGIPEPPFPSGGAIGAAARFLDARAGRTAFAVVDSRGRVSGVRLHEHFQSASVVKVMMLVAYLRRVAAEHRGLDSSDVRLLYPMIHISDNEAASAVLSIVGGAALQRIAREVGMTDYAPGVGWWAFTQTSAIDQARFFYLLPRLIPARFYGYARYLLSTIEPSQSWGVPPVARPRWQVFFKTGALPSEGLFNEVARLERGPVTFTVAVFTDGDPSMAYGEGTIEGVGRELLAGSP
jgi:hypothetical protein